DRRDAYEQVYLSKSQTVLYLPAGNLAEYNRAVQGDLSFEPGRAKFLGFLGTQANRPTEPGERQTQLVDALNKALSDYQKVQANDRRMRDLVQAGKRAQAIAAHRRAAEDFAEYDRSLQA